MEFREVMSVTYMDVGEKTRESQRTSWFWDINRKQVIHNLTSRIIGRELICPETVCR